MNLETLYLDMDGVLCDFVTGAFKALGIHHWETYMKQSEDLSTWAGKSNEEIWDKIHDLGVGFWDLPKYEHSDFLVEWLTRLTTSNNASLYILTDPGPYPEESIPGKLKWLEAYYPHISPKHVIFTSRKHLLSRRGALLIDDQLNNYNDFSRSGDGKSVWFRHPWHHDFVNMDHSLNDVIRRVTSLVE